eukprot:GILK01004377.1.p1 GENE.GILK01004377.1~~GILK01004377.1.p1  ORF type:complete len:1016 (+),score=152.15 GILK01004377.1:46-3048(+)
MASHIEAVFFDLGGVVITSPFESFARYERAKNVASGSINKVIAEAGAQGSFARLERGELTLTEFYPLLDAECRARGISISARELFDLVHTEAGIVPEMFNAIDILKKNGFKVGAITNNWKLPEGSFCPPQLVSLFDVIIESALVGISKPDARIFRLACEKLNVSPHKSVFLDDIGRNLKAAKELGFHTIKVDDPLRALSQLQKLLGVSLLSVPPWRLTTTPVRKGHQFDQAVLLRYLQAQAPQLFASVQALEVRQFEHGQSNPTFLLNTGEQQYVLRKKPSGKLLPSAHMIEREYHIMTALSRADFPVPRTVCLCEDNNVIGTAFYVMAYIEGRIFKNISLPGVSPHDRAIIYEQLISTLAKLHSLDFRALGLGEFGKTDGKYLQRQVVRWGKQYDAAATSDIPAMNQLKQWFAANCPKEERVSIVHGDYRLDNIIFHPTQLRVIAVLDWELSTIGEPFSDLAYCLMPFCWPPETQLATPSMKFESRNIPGIPSESQLVSVYCQTMGMPTREIANLKLYQAFSLFRMASIAQGVYKRSLQGNASSAHAHQFGAAVQQCAQLALELAHKCNKDVAKISATPCSASSSDVHSLFVVSPRVEELRQRVAHFMKENLFPKEKELFDYYSTTNPNRWTIHPLIEELKSKAKAAGLWNLFLPVESDPQRKYGFGLTNLEYAHICEVMGKSPLAPELFNCNAPDTGNMEVLVRYGTEAQKKQWLLPLLEGTIRSAFAMTEPRVASSDATNIETTIRRVHDKYVINGTKWYISGAGDPRCKIAIVMGRSGDEKTPPHQRHSMILCPMDAPGLTVKRTLGVFGYDDAPHGHVEMIFNNVSLPLENILLGEGRGFEIAQGRLGPGRIHHCMRAMGVAERALELMCERALTRKAFGKPLAAMGTVQADIAKSRMEIEQARLLTLRAAQMMDTVGNKAAKAEIAMIKVVAPNVALRVLDRAIQVHGAAGVSDDFMLAYFYATTRTLRLADGPDEVHRQTVAKMELAKYRSKL